MQNLSIYQAFGLVISKYTSEPSVQYILSMGFDVLCEGLTEDVLGATIQILHSARGHMTFETTDAVAVQTVGVPSFLDNPINLKKLLREVSKHTAAAVETLVEIMNDPNAEQKTRLGAASKLLEMQADVAKVISQDAIQRLVAEVRLNPTGTKRLKAEDDSERPLVDFSTVQAV